MGDDPVRRDVVAEGMHTARIVADGLQGKAEGGALEIADHGVGDAGDRQAQIVERQRRAPIDTEQLRRSESGEAGEAVEDGVVLIAEIEDGDADRQGDHDRVDALGPDRDHTDQRGDGCADQDGAGHNDPPRAAEPEFVAVGSQDGDHVAGHPGNGHLRQRHHAAVSRQHHQRQGDDAEQQALRPDLHDEEIVGPERIDDQQQGDDQMPGAQIEPDAGGGAARGGFELRQRHHRFPMIPVGRTASTMTMTRKV